MPGAGGKKRNFCQDKITRETRFANFPSRFAALRLCALALNPQVFARITGPDKLKWSMILVTSNRSKQLLCVNYIGRVRAEEFQQSREDFLTQLGELSPGFSLLGDFSALESMALECGPELGRMMESVGQAGVGLVVRVIPDPNKDIGMNILTKFHYTRQPRVATCETLSEAARALGL